MLFEGGPHLQTLREMKYSDVNLTHSPPQILFSHRKLANCSKSDDESSRLPYTHLRIAAWGEIWCCFFNVFGFYSLLKCFAILFLNPHDDNIWIFFSEMTQTDKQRLYCKCSHNSNVESFVISVFVNYVDIMV